MANDCDDIQRKSELIRKQLRSTKHAPFSFIGVTLKACLLLAHKRHPFEQLQKLAEMTYQQRQQWEKSEMRTKVVGCFFARSNFIIIIFNSKILNGNTICS